MHDKRKSRPLKHLDLGAIHAEHLSEDEIFARLLVHCPVRSRVQRDHLWLVLGESDTADLQRIILLWWILLRVIHIGEAALTRAWTLHAQ